MANETKLMGRVDPTSGELKDIQYYRFAQYNGDADLVDLNAFPTEDFGPWTYNSGTKLAEAAVSALTLNLYTITVTPDGVATQAVIISGPIGAVVDAVFSGPVPIDGVQWTLDGSGNATVTFGPTTLRTVTPLKVKFDLQDGSSPVPVELEINLQ
jgi:hypothetical protein